MPTARQDARRRLPAGAPRHRRGRTGESPRSGHGPTSSSTSATRSCSTLDAGRQGHRRDRRLGAPGQARRHRRRSSCRSKSCTCSTARAGLTLGARRRGRSPEPERDHPTQSTAPEDASGADLVERVVDSRVLHRGPLPDVPGRHDRARRRLARDPRHRRPSGGRRDPRPRRPGPRAARAPVRVPRSARRCSRSRPGRSTSATTARSRIPTLAARRELEEETGMRAGTGERSPSSSRHPASPRS